MPPFVKQFEHVAEHVAEPVLSALAAPASLYTNAQRQRQLGFVLDIRKD